MRSTINDFCMQKERLGAALACGAFFFAALAPRFAVASFSAELLLVPEESRDAVVQSLRREGRAREASVLAAAWRDGGGIPDEADEIRLVVSLEACRGLALAREGLP